jgi:hypothetical protein
LDTPVVLGVTVAGLVAIAVTAAIVSFGRKLARARGRARFIRQYAFPAELRDSLQRDGGFSLAQSDQVLEALKQYFLACLLARRSGLGKLLGMPSKAVDDAWRQFDSMAEYEEFCFGAFGKYLVRTPIAAEDSDKPLANTLHQLKKITLLPARWAMVGKMPLIFALDRELGVKDGHIYDDAAFQTLKRQRRYFLALAGGGFAEMKDNSFDSGEM